ncbi:putative nuclease HARBI1, partial [Homalodisca vitripennis]|uniref:putative nuclease HARBI1 n=1 Tax=Homalodisca vitripennis TaxID=197043 RepID=UPI001EEB6436
MTPRLPAEGDRRACSRTCWSSPPQTAEHVGLGARPACSDEPSAEPNMLAGWNARRPHTRASMFAANTVTSMLANMLPLSQFLASGRSYENLKFSCAISPQALGKIIPETCAAIFDVLKEDFLKFPCNESDWMNIAVDFKKYWQVENCVGAIDGKHIAIRQPPKSGSYYYNYKGFHSI